MLPPTSPDAVTLMLPCLSRSTTLAHISRARQARGGDDVVRRRRQDIWEAFGWSAQAVDVGAEPIDAAAAALALGLRQRIATTGRLMVVA
eukprot:2211815-Alexandrium_andersonii.AAC.1